jgi:hypothetical protein
VRSVKCRQTRVRDLRLTPLPQPRHFPTPINIIISQIKVLNIRHRLLAFHVVNRTLRNVALALSDLSLNLALLKYICDLLSLFRLSLQSVIDELSLILIEPLISIESPLTDLDHFVNQQ